MRFPVLCSPSYFSHIYTNITSSALTAGVHVPPGDTELTRIPSLLKSNAWTYRLIDNCEWYESFALLTMHLVKVRTAPLLQLYVHLLGSERWPETDAMFTMEHCFPEQ